MDSIHGQLILKEKKGRPVRRRHPWIFSGAIHRITGDPAPGDLVHVLAADGDWLATAYYNPHSQIRGRILSWSADEVVDRAFWRRRLTAALARRERWQLAPATDTYRAVYGEADDLPGLIVDRYGDYWVMQCLTLGVDRRKQLLAELLAELTAPAGIWERSDADVRRKEGLSETTGRLWGEAPPPEVVVRENDWLFGVDLREGHKTGFYLDQRENRLLLGRPELVAGKRVLNAFSYTGGFAVYAAGGGAAQITNLDSSADVLAAASANLERNQLTPPEGIENVTGDAFQVLREYRDSGRQFDVIILDPPKFAHSRRDVDRACRGYKDLNWLALRLLAPGGLLATFSCSGLIDADLFQKVVFGAALDAGRSARISHHLRQGPDHPVLLTFPEAAYLKGLLLQVD